MQSRQAAIKWKEIKKPVSTGMSLFTEFVSTLLPDERNVLAELPVRGKQSAILHAVVKNPLNDEHLRKEMAKLKVSPAYLHSVQSALLRRAYDLFVPSGGIDLLLFLRIRGLDVHFKHELNTQERALEAHNASLEERHEFYLRLLNLLFAVSTLRFEPKLILAVLSLYERTIVIPHPDDKLHIRICKALAEVVSTSGSPTRIDRTPRRKDVLERLTALKDELGESDHHLARYHIDYAFAVYYA
ncbi:MAG TPA: hypothetical protein VET48_07520, partial [Steroidobacteraceae bacterium]|nr:hypothetical protein [Steroidobacteraceae bacterium]